MPNLLSMTSRESLLVGVDFSNQMETGETIDASNSNGTTAVTAVDGDGAVAAVIEDASMVIDGQTLSARLEGLTAGVSYTVRFLAATSVSDVLETSVRVTVPS